MSSGSEKPAGRSSYGKMRDGFMVMNVRPIVREQAGEMAEYLSGLRGKRVTMQEIIGRAVDGAYKAYKARRIRREKALRESATSE